MLIQKKLLPLLRAGHVFTVEEAAKCLALDSAKRAAQILARYAKRQMIVRIKRGLYLPVTSRFSTGEEAFSNPWIAVPSLFLKSYIGGWSAAHHWGFTDQLFQSTCVLTTEPILRPKIYLKKFTYALFKAPTLKGTEALWIEQEKILISNPHKTILDIFDNPKCGAGITQVIECFQSYLTESFDLSLFLKEAEHYKNGALFKRLGYISERLLGINHPLCIFSKTRLTKGYSKLEFESTSSVLISRWNLFIPKGFSL